MSNDGSGGNGTADASVGAMMKAYTEGMQAQFGAMMNKVRANMEQSMGMAQMMNDMMEHFLLQGLALRCLVKPGAPMQIHLEMSNTGTMLVPVVSSTTSLRYRLPPLGGHDADNSRPLFEFKSIPSDLDVHQSASFDIPLALPSIDQYNGQVVLSCVSPGTGQRLQKVLEFSIYFLQQLVIAPCSGPLTIQAQEQAQAQTSTRELPLQALRRVLRVPPTQGLHIAPAGYFALSLPSASAPILAITLSLANGTNSSSDGELCVVQVHQLSSPPEGLYRLTPAEISMELEALAQSSLD